MECGPHNCETGANNNRSDYGSQSITFRPHLYTFSVNGEKLEGSSGADDRHNVGDQVTVFYDPIDPNKSDLRDYKDLALRNFGLVPFALTGIAGITWYIWYARSRNKPIPDTPANFPRKKLT
jgi:hypothetical protein